MIKPSEVKFIDDELEKSYDQLEENDFLKKAIKKAVRELNQNAFCGTQVAKRLIPREYIKKYRINNLWKYNLPKGWRLMYTVVAKDQVQLITAILEWLKHKDYERKFKY